jgi:hypothetical protein
MRARLFVVLAVLALLPSGVIGQEQRDDGGLARLDGQRWVPVDGYGVRLSVAPNGEPWVVNSRNEIWQSASGGSFEKLPGEARDIGIGADGTVWIIGTDSGIYRWNQNNWDRVEGSGVAISSASADEDADGTGITTRRQQRRCRRAAGNLPRLADRQRLTRLHIHSPERAGVSTCEHERHSPSTLFAARLNERFAVRRSRSGRVSLPRRFHHH